MAENKDKLIAMDGIVGDGDLGLTMSDGFKAAYEAAADGAAADAGQRPPESEPHGVGHHHQHAGPGRHAGRHRGNEKNRIKRQSDHGREKCVGGRPARQQESFKARAGTTPELQKGAQIAGK